MAFPRGPEENLAHRVKSTHVVWMKACAQAPADGRWVWEGTKVQPH